MPHPPHHEHRGRPHQGPEWLVAVRDDGLPRSSYAQHLSAIGSVLAGGPVLQVGSTSIEVPDTVAFDLRFERTPHNSLVLVIKAEWHESRAARTELPTARGLVIKAPETTAAHPDVDSVEDPT